MRKESARSASLMVHYRERRRPPLAKAPVACRRHPIVADQRAELVERIHAKARARMAAAVVAIEVVGGGNRVRHLFKKKFCSLQGCRTARYLRHVKR